MVTHCGLAHLNGFFFTFFFYSHKNGRDLWKISSDNGQVATQCIMLDLL